MSFMRDLWDLIKDAFSDQFGIQKCNVTGLPLYIRLGRKGTRMRLIAADTYYRDGGQWSTKFVIRNGRMYSHIPNMKHIDNKLLVPTTYNDWKKDNGQYYPGRYNGKYS